VSDRVAAFDIGTNTVLLLVAERGPDGPRAVVERAEITRLGRGVDRTRRLDDAAIGRTLDALSRFAAEARASGATSFAAVATSASRDAENGAEFRARAEAIVGGVVEIVSGRREADLTFRGALGGLGIEGSRVAVVDVGGGSTEIVVGVEGACTFAHSYDVGSVRLTERHVPDDPPTAADLAAVRAAARGAYATPAPPPGPYDAVVAIAGTATTYAAVELEIARYEEAPPHGARLSVATLERQIERLAGLPLASRGEVVGLDPKRADVIVAGGLVLVEAARALGAAEIVVSDRGVRWGLADELLCCSASKSG
jgi:exopolyphosphatase/guanosine-5'-triphosphate,3'-diphosphate pyrophosphatase